MYKVVIEVKDSLFIESLKFLSNNENIQLSKNAIELKNFEVSKLRASANLIFRLLKIYDDFKRNKMPCL